MNTIRKVSHCEYKTAQFNFFSFGSWCWNSGSATGRYSSLSYTSSQPSISGVWLGPPKPEFNSCWVYKVTLSSQPDRGLCHALRSATVGFGRGARGGVARGAVPARLPALRSVHSALGSTCRSIAPPSEPVLWSRPRTTWEPPSSPRSRSAPQRGAACGSCWACEERCPRTCGGRRPRWRRSRARW